MIELNGHFLKNIMLKMGLAPQWVALMMECINSISYSILVNGSPRGFFQPTRGFRQGDPLSPYIFLLCTEGLHGLINKVVNDNVVQGISLNRGGPKISLFFAYDNLLFCRATRSDCESILDILTTYEAASGQQINRAIFKQVFPFPCYNGIA